MKGILGVGNLLMKDEGFGVHVVRQIHETGALPPEVELMDGGTAGMALMSFFQQCRHVLVIDIINLDKEPGTLVSFSRQDFAGIVRTQRTSPHQIGILDILEILDLEDSAPQVDFMCAVPKEISEGLELSPPLRQAAARAAGLAVEWARN